MATSVESFNCEELMDWGWTRDPLCQTEQNRQQMGSNLSVFTWKNR